MGLLKMKVVRQTIRRVGKKFLINVGSLLYRTRGKGRVIVLCYHSISPKKSFSSATPALFREHLYWLREHCEVIRFSEVLNYAKSNVSERPRVAITFDDGYNDNYDYALPILREFGFPATIFLTVGFLENDSVVVKRLQSFYRDRISPLSWDQVVEMQKEGIEIGAHTYSHRNLARLDYNELVEELGVSKHIIEKRTGNEVDLVAYPFGLPKRFFNERVVEVAQALGYQYGATIMGRAVKRTDHPLSIPRFYIHHDSLDVLAAKVYGRWDILSVWYEKAPLWLVRLVSPVEV